MNSTQRSILRQRGFALVEMLIGLAALALVSSGAYTIWSAHERESNRHEKPREVRTALSRSPSKHGIMP